MNHLIIISGPGGSGKDAIIAELLKNPSLNLKKLANYTSRPMRIGERQSIDYHFVSKQQFEQQIEQGNMLEYEIMSANGQYYGTHKGQLEEDLQSSNIICKKMPVGALTLKKHFGSQAITIFIDANDAELERRLKEASRVSEHDQIQKRLKQAAVERQLKGQFDFCIPNHDGDLPQVTNLASSIIQSAIAQ